MVSLCFPIFFHPDCTVGFGVSPNHALRLVGCTTGRESHPALKILDSISGSIIAWYITECKPFLKPGQNRDGTTFRRRTLSRGLAPSSSLSFCQSFHRVFLQAAESDVFSKVRVREAQRSKRELAAWQAEQAHHTPSKEKQSVPDGERPVVHIVIVCGLWQGASAGAHPIFVSSWLGVRQNAFTGSFSPWLYRGWFCAVPPSGRTIPPLQGRREQRRHWFWYPVRRSFPYPQRTA